LPILVVTKKEIGYRIRKLRESRDYTQDNMAAELGITAGAYAKIERGETDASITRLYNIAEILKVDITSFLRDAFSSSKVEEPANPYGYASKADLDNLTRLIKQMGRDLEKLKLEMATVQKPKAKKPR
jgi:transcriptional regulator with XRE-family HTH domain